MTSLNVDSQAFRYRAMIGTGGIGAGMFFALQGNQTLGREESRAGRFLDQRDYCKLHIISHYVKVLLGPDFPVLLVGMLGDDEVGRRLASEMTATGLDIRHVAVIPGEQTMLSVCFLYPDGTGGNLTVDDSACNRVDAAFVRQAEPDFLRFAGHGIVLAAPEVPLPARRQLLELASQHGFLRAASFTSGEILAAAEMGLLAMTDLLAINVDEAASLLDWSVEERQLMDLVEAALKRLQSFNPRMRVSITAGRRGSWCWDGNALNHQPALPVKVVASAGAGDAHFAAILVGLVTGLALPQAHELAALVAALSVTSPHTIHPALERETLRIFVEQLRVSPSPAIHSLLGEDEIE